jgi:hypothetical protein
LVLAAGYRRDEDDILRMPLKAVKRKRQGRYAGPIPSGLRKVRKGTVGGGWRAGLSPALPARIKCWKCDNVSDADPRTLQVESATRDVLVTLNEAFPDSL